MTKIDLIGLMGCGTTSFYRYLADKGHNVHRFDGPEYMLKDKVYENNIYIILRKDVNEIKKSWKKRGRNLKYLQPMLDNLDYWKDLGAQVFYLEDMQKDPDFPHINKFGTKDLVTENKKQVLQIEKIKEEKLA